MPNIESIHIGDLIDKVNLSNSSDKIRAIVANIDFVYDCIVMAYRSSLKYNTNTCNMDTVLVLNENGNFFITITDKDKLPINHIKDSVLLRFPNTKIAIDDFTLSSLLYNFNPQLQVKNIIDHLND